jgi:Tfp pilus assembly PilM family ATPase
MSVIASWLASPPPDAALAIAPESVSIAMLGTRGQPSVQGYAIEPLPPGAVVGSLTAHNILDRAAVLAAVRSAIDRLGARPRRVALIIPDLAARVSLVRFDRVPARREDLDQLVRWQMKKAAPFPVEDACVSYTPGARGADGSGEFVVVLARREVIREYEGICDEAGIYAGLVDLATLSVVNLCLASPTAASGDSLVVYIRPEYTSLAILRGQDVIFFRTRAEDGGESLADLVHQTSMYYQDRLSGQGFTRVILGGIESGPGALATARRSVEERLGIVPEPLDPTQSAMLSERITASPELLALLAPLVGMLLRTRRESVTA